MRGRLLLLSGRDCAASEWFGAIPSSVIYEAMDFGLHLSVEVESEDQQLLEIGVLVKTTSFQSGLKERGELAVSNPTVLHIDVFRRLFVLVYLDTY